jgi:Protein of unknown function (DUF1656)
MTQTYRELVIGGVLFAPLVAYAAAAIVIFLVLRPVLHSIGVFRLISHPPIAELSLYIAILGLLALLF